MRHQYLSWTLLAGLAFVVPGCGDDDDNGGTSGRSGSGGRGGSAGRGTAGTPANGSGGSGGDSAGGSAGDSTGGSGGDSTSGSAGSTGGSAGSTGGSGGSGATGGSGGSGATGGSGGSGATGGSGGSGATGGSGGSGATGGSGGSGATGGSGGSGATGGSGGSGAGGSGAGGSGAGGSGAGGSGAGGSGGGGNACTTLKVNSDLKFDGNRSYITTDVSPDLVVIGGKDEFGLELWGAPGFPTLVPGVFDLASPGYDDNYATCGHCFLLFALDANGNVAKTFYQESGTLTMTVVTDPITVNAAASVDNLKMVEVIIDPGTAISTPVPGGECLTLQTYDFVSGNGAGGSGGGGGNLETCKAPDGTLFCGDKSAGECYCDDECTKFGDCCPDKNELCGGGGGGAAGAAGASGSGGSGGSAGSPACVEIKLGAGLQPAEDIFGDIFGYVTTSVAPDIVVPGGLDEFQLHLYGTSLELPPLVPGTFNLGAGIETNFSSCAHCVLVFSLDTEGGTSKTFFQQSGTLNLTDVDDPLTADAAASMTNLKLVEVTIDPNTFASTPVPGGACLTMANYSFDSSPLSPVTTSARAR